MYCFDDIPFRGSKKFNKDVMTIAKDYLVNWRKTGDRIPMVSGLLLEIGRHGMPVSRNTIYVWAAKYPQFKAAIELLKLLQVRELKNGGLAGTHNAVITKLLLAADHGYMERQAVELDATLALTNLSDEELDERISRLTPSAAASPTPAAPTESDEPE
jgi:hypothetical protein